MIFSVYKKKRRNSKGKMVSDRLYRGKYRLDGDYQVTDISLNTADKQVAEKLLRDIVAEQERVKAGLIATKLERTSAEKPIIDHLVDFKSDLRAKQVTEKYEKLLGSRVETIVNETGWNMPCDISRDGFMLWRAKRKNSAKTLNEYLNAINGLLNWMVRYERIPNNPLANIEHINLKGKQQKRRALSDEELQRLLDSAENYRVLYLTASYTGLRLNELKQLLWSDVHLDQHKPHFQVRDTTTKNRKPAIVPLHQKLVPEIESVRGENGDFVFPQNPNSNRWFTRHIKAANIERIDASGKKVDFHSLRYTFATKLAKQGVSQRLAQELMRHSDPKLTANLYTDVAQLPTFQAIDSLEWLENTNKLSRPQIRPQTPDFWWQNLSFSVTHETVIHTTQLVDFEEESRDLTSAVTSGQNHVLVEATGVEPVS